MDQHRAALTRTVGRRATRVALVAVPLAFLGIFFVYPVASIIGRGLTGNGGFDSGAVLDVFRDENLRRIAWFTLWQAAVSTVLTFIVAWPLTYVVARVAIPGRRLVRALVIVPFGM